MFFKSIRWRLQLWQAFLLVCILTGFGATAFQLYRTNAMRQIDEELDRRVSALAGDVRGRPPFDKPGREPFDKPPGPEGFGPHRGREGFGPPPERPPFASSPDSQPARRPGFDFKEPRDWKNFFELREIRLTARTLSLFDAIETNGFYYGIWSIGGKLRHASTNVPSDISLPTRADNDIAVRKRTRGVRREAYQFTEIGECVLAGRLIGADLAAMRRFAWWLAGAGAGVLALGLGGGWWVASRAIRPVEVISAAASRISAGSLSERIDIADTDSELGRLAGVLNSTFTRLECAFAQQQQFTADASHELRTPIAVIISESQTTLARERTAGEYRETVETCLEAAQQMRRLTQSLLELARYDAGQEDIDRSSLDLAEQTRACVEFVGPLARERGIQIHCDLSSAAVLGDAARLGQAITNLLNNAIFYNRDQGEIHVRTCVEKDAAILTIADTGPGISPDDISHVFERFYRADKSRSGSSGRSGLGLAICKAIVDAHGGFIEAASQPGKGAEFTIRLLLNHA
jgi:heavy metal sensor kinase